MPASSSPWKSFAEENRNHGILDVLSRPVLLTNSSSLWSTAKNRNEPPTESLANSVFSFPSAILNRSQNIVKKLEGFTYFRANVKVRVMVNAQAFSQGKLWIWFSPYELASGTQFAADNLACKTGYPGVELDVASGQPAEFTIPYCAPMSHYCLTSGEGTMGDLFLTVLSPLTISDASLSVFAWFEDIDLQLPTGVPMGDPPATRYAIAPRQNVLFEVPTASPAAPGKVTSTFWGSKTLVCDGVDKAIATESFAIFPTPFNTPVSCIMVPVGTVFKATTVQHPNAPAEYNIVITTLQGYTGVLGTDMSQSGPDSNISMTMIQGANSIMAYEDGHEYVTPYYLFLNYKSDAAYSSTACSIPGILQCPVDQYVLTTDFFVVVGYRIDFYGPNTKVSYKVNNGEALVEINSASHQLATFATYSTLDDCYVSAIFKTDITKTGYFAFSQADSKDEDEWYKNYPHAQISESEHQAMSSLVTSSLGKVIAASTPMLAPLKTPLSWLSRLGTAVAAGYSKPVDVEKPRCIYNVPAKGFTHGEGPDNSVNLGVIPDNSLAVESNLFSTSIDELDISYVCKKSCFLRSDAWSTTSTGRIYSLFVGPGICHLSQAGYESTLLAFATSIFRFWHGSLRYRISVAKTGFHTGRLRISFHPGAMSTSAVYNADNAYSWILDLSSSSEIDIEVPYVTPKPWLITDLTSEILDNPYGPSPSEAGPAIEGSNNLNYFTGVLQIEVLNQLRSAGAASNSVDILTWISAGDSFELAVPSFSNFRPCSNQYPTFSLTRAKRDLEMQFPDVIEEELEEDPSNTPASEEEEEQVVPEAQAFQTITDASTHTEQLDGNTFTQFFNSNSSFSNASTLCIGEKATNFRVLLKRFTPFVFKEATTSNNLSSGQVVIDPVYFGVSYPIESTYNGPFPIYDSDFKIVGSYTNCECPIEYISKIYRFWSGSRRFKAFSGNSSTGDNAIQQFAVRAYLETSLQVNGPVHEPKITKQYFPNYENFASSKGSFAHMVDGVNNKCCEVSVPFYSQTPIQVVSNGTALSNADDYVMRYRLFFDSGGSADNQSKPFVIYQAAGDDFNFGYLIGAPLLKKLKQAAVHIY